MNLPTKYKWLASEGGPKMLNVFLNLYGLKEVVGSNHNPVILAWARELGIEKVYNQDEIPWCGLIMYYAAFKSGKYIPFSAKDGLWALNWTKFGTKVKTPMLGDVLVFKRPSGGHVGLYIGEDSTTYYVIGGNQGNQISIIRIEKNRLVSAVRPPYNTQPANIRQIFLTGTGEISKNEQ